MAKPKEKPEIKASKIKTAKKSGRQSSKPAKAKSQKPKVEKTPAIHYCSFCGKSSKEQNILIAGPKNIFICDKCVYLCDAFLFDFNKEDCVSQLIKIITGEIKIQFRNENSKERKKINGKAYSE
jgi:hypothetical protein